MALELSSRVCEGCDSLTFTDTTGLYSVDNLTGYGPENGVDGPSDFTTYTLEVWFPGSDLTGDPDYTYNLLTVVPTPDADDYYTWTITKAMLGIDPIVSGVYNFTVTGILSPATYLADTEVIFIKDLEKQIDAKMVDYDPTCPCKKGCTDKAQLYAEFLVVKCGGICNSAKAQDIIDALYSKTKNCC